jgi:ferredoxin--NADP+ reductase
MFTVVRKHTFTNDLFLLEIEVTPVARRAAPGHHVDIRLNPDTETITLPIADADPEKGTITVVDRALDLPRERLMMLHKGDEIFQVRGPLGTPVTRDAASKVVIVGEGLGVASLLWRARKYRREGVYTIAILAFATRDDMFWENEFAAACDELYVATEDGTYGISGKVTGPVRAVCETYSDVERLVMIGNLKNMKRAAKIAEDNGISARMSFDAIRTPAGAASIFDVADSSQEAFTFARASELDARQIDFDKLITKQRAIAGDAPDGAARP